MADYTLTAKLTADTKGLQSGFQKAQSSLANLQGKTAAFGNGLKNIGKSISGVGDRLTRSITMPATIAASALTGVTLVKGFNRLTGIDTAQAKLKGLGHDAESVELIMTSALDSVRGTSFGMDEAATTAASAVAAGIKPGKELTRYLSLTGDAAAIAGDSMADMGSIINKVQTAQKAYTGDLNMLSDRGIPIYQWLAEEAGTTAEAVRDMASSGEISSEMFLNAVENNIGGAAKTMGEESFTAGIANIGAAIGRLGANFLDAGGEAGGFFSTVKPLIGDAIGFIDTLADSAADMGVKFGEAFNNFLTKVGEMKARFDALSPPVQSFITKAAGIGAIVAVGIGPALKIVGMLVSSVGFLTSGLALLMGPVGLVIAGIAGLIAIGVLLYKNWETVKETAQNVFSNFAPMLDIVKGAFQNLTDSIQPIWESLKTLWESLIPIFEMVGAVVGGVLAVSFGVVVSTLNAVLAAIGPVINAFINLVDFAVNVVNTIVALFTGDFAGAMEFWEAATQASVDFFVNLFEGVVNFVTTFVSTIISFFSGLYNTLVGNSIIPDMVNAIVDWFKNMIDWAMNIIRPIIAFFGSVITGIMNVVKPIISFFTSTFTGVYNTAVNIFNRVRSFISGSISSISGVIGSLASTVSNVFSRIYSTASNIMNRVKSVFTTVFGAIRGAWSGLTGMVSNIFSGIQSSVQTLVTQVKGFINIVIRSINSAIGLINKIPGVNISKIPQLQRGTDDWAGGFAYMNEGGRGELVNLPGGTQVIPHDVSMRYAREAGKRNNQGTVIADMGGNSDTLVATAVRSLEKALTSLSMNMDGKEVARIITDDIDRNLGNRVDLETYMRGSRR